MNSRALTVPLLVCFILGSYVVIVEQVQATASPSPSASAGWFSSSASVSVSISNLQTYTTDGQLFTGTADVYANSYPDTEKDEGATISAVIGRRTVARKRWVGGPYGGYEVTVTTTESYIKASESASERNWGQPAHSKWALAKGTVSGTFKRRWANYHAPFSGSGS